MENGVIREMDKLGRIVIPKEWRDELEMYEKDQIEINKRGNEIVIKKHKVSCHCCGKVSKDLIDFKGLKLCKNCVQEVTKYAKKCKEMGGF